MTKSNSRRFVRAAWSLLFFQVIASAGAVAVTGWAVFHVQNLSAVQTPGALATTEAAPPAAATTTNAIAPTQTAETPLAPASGAAAPAPEVTMAPTLVVAQIAPCPRSQRFWRVPAEAEWCDTGLDVKQGQHIAVRLGEGQWSNAGRPSFRQDGIGAVIAGTWVERAPLGALIGRVGETSFLIGSQQSIASPADGHLLLAMNDVRGTYGDNQGGLDVYVAVQ